LKPPEPITAEVVEEVRRQGGDWRVRLLLDARLRHAEQAEERAEQHQAARRRGAAEARSYRKPTGERDKRLRDYAIENHLTAGQLRLRLLANGSIRAEILGQDAVPESVPSLRQLQRILSPRRQPETR
jgi:hypothetical protein